jgi:predicted O-methyltransferase YrrM
MLRALASVYGIAFTLAEIKPRVLQALLYRHFACFHPVRAAMSTTKTTQRVRSRFQKLSRKWKNSILKRRVILEDFFQPDVIRCISQDEYYRTYRADRAIWDRLKAEFHNEICVANSVDPEVLFSLVERLKPASFLEIGTFRGGTVAAVKTILPATTVFTINHPSPESFAINPLERNQIGIAFRRRGLDVKLLWADSADLQKLNIPSCDMIFVDGDHSRAAVLRDFENCWLYLKPGGYMVFHDFIPPGAPERPFHTRYVVSAFRQFSRLHRHEFEEAFHVADSWLGVVRKRLEAPAQARVAA